MTLRQTIEYAVTLTLILVLALTVMEILHMLLPTPWFVGVSLLCLVVICPMCWTVEEQIFGETTFEEEP